MLKMHTNVAVKVLDAWIRITAVIVVITTDSYRTTPGGADVADATSARELCADLRRPVSGNDPGARVAVPHGGGGDQVTADTGRRRAAQGGAHFSHTLTPA